RAVRIRGPERHHGVGVPWTFLTVTHDRTKYHSERGRETRERSQERTAPCGCARGPAALIRCERAGSKRPEARRRGDETRYGRGAGAGRAEGRRQRPRARRHAGAP